MSEVCYRGHKCMCFQCGEKDCEKYQAEPPEWIEKLLKDDQLMDILKKATQKGMKYET